MVGKLNYTNRKITGSKLGAAVKRDVLKYVPTPSKAARSHKDPHLELNLQGKALCNDGLHLACEGLKEAILAGAVKLDELNLSENHITLEGLKHLESVIRLASRELKDLDLRCNELRVITDEDAEVWEGFLSRGFRDVCNLRRLDISENPIGDRGFEIFLRVYARENPIMLPRLAGSLLAESTGEEPYIDSEDEEDEEDEEDPGMTVTYEKIRCMSISDPSRVPKALTSPQSSPLVLSKSPYAGSLNRRSSSLSISTSLASNAAELHGLRSIPYLIFSQTEITDKSALFLSHILPMHPTPDRLLCHLPAPRPGCQTEVLEHYDHTSGCSGIIYEPNDALTAIGVNLLHLAEGLRDGSISPTLSSYSSSNRRCSDASILPQTPLKSRRNSFPNSSFIPHVPPCNMRNGTTELERARSKVEGTLLKDIGPNSVELWRTALRMLVVSRAILFDEDAIMSERLTRVSSHSLSPAKISSSVLNNLVGSSPNSPLDHHNTPHSPLLTNNSPWNSIHYPRQKLNVITPELPSQSSLYEDLEEDTIVTLQDFQEKREKITLPKNLTEELWAKIITFSCDPKGILTERQRMNVFEWAKTRETLERERCISGKLKSAQIWRVLDGLECLGYEF